MFRAILLFILIANMSHAVKRTSFKPRAKEFKYFAPRVVSLEQHQIYGKDYIDIYFKFTSKVNLDKMTLELSGINDKAHILYDGQIHQKQFEIHVPFKNKMSKIQFRVLKNKPFGLLSFKLVASYQYPVDSVLEYIADRHKTDYLVDSARFDLIEIVKNKKGKAQNDFSLNIYGKKFLK